MSDTEGDFNFTNLEEGRYSISISFIGYAPKTLANLTINAQKKEILLGTIELKPDASQLDQVIINSLRPTIVQMADRMVVNIEGTALAAGTTAYHVLKNAPGVYIDQEGNIQLNGKSGVTVMLDDRLTYLSAKDLRLLLEGMSAENIKNIEIITNPSARYDAEGSSGILNINLRKNTRSGINGSVNTGYNYNGKQHGYSTGGRIDYKIPNWNSFLNFDWAKRVGGREATFTRVFFGEEETIYFDQVAVGNYLVQGPPTVRGGTDYSFDENHSLGVVVNFVKNKVESEFLTDTYIGSSSNNPYLYIDADNISENIFSSFTTNLHYTGKLDTLGTKISADVDFVKIRKQGESNFFNYFIEIDSGNTPEQDFLYTNSPTGFDIYSAKIDFTKSFLNGPTMETGVKGSTVASDADSRFYFNNNGLVADPLRSNHFLFEEYILAAYISLDQKLGEKFSLQAGLRAEHTSNVGESLTTGEVNEQDYLNLFPSVFLQHNVSENYQVNYSYSRRIQRPNYGSLNPFIIYRDPQTFVQGNPGLRPQFTQAFGITQTLFKKYSLALNYQYVKDVISEIPILVEETATTIYTTGNVDDSKNFSLTGIAPFKIMKNWDSNNTLVVSYNEFNMLVEDMQLENSALFYSIQSNHNILLPFKIKMDINAGYLGPGVSGLYKMASRWWVDGGLKRSFLDNKLELSLNVNDIFKSYRLIFTTNIGDNINEFDQYFRDRAFGISLRYNFSSGEKFETRQRNTKVEEVDRT